MGEALHVTPENDLREHVCDSVGLCPCLPTRSFEDSNVFVHNSYDGREVREVVERALDMLGLALNHHGHQWSPRLRWVYEQAHAIVKMHCPNQVEGVLTEADKEDCRG
jgi:hypothetical protein